MDNLYKYEDFTVIIGDIIDSKQISDRKTVQNKFKSILLDINEKYSKDIVSKFKITLGDEFQGLLKNRNNIIKIIFEIEMSMAPVQFRFGVGIGSITTDISLENSAEIDGPAYHRAREMIEQLQIKKSQYTKPQANILLASQEKNFEIDNLLNSILSVCTALKSKWTKRQTEVINTYLLNEENQYKTADKLNVGQSSVNKVLNSANFYTYKSAMDSVNTFLNDNGVDEND